MIKDIPGYEGKYAITDDGQVYTYQEIENFFWLSLGEGDK